MGFFLALVFLPRLPTLQVIVLLASVTFAGLFLDADLVLCIYRSVNFSQIVGSIILPRLLILEV